jgi:allene oxide cyclase
MEGSKVKRFGLLSALIALVALAVGVVSPALGSSSGDDDGLRTIRLVAVNTEGNFLDFGAKGDTLGDYFVFTHKLLRRGERVGHVGGQCTIVVSAVAGAESEPQCVVTASLPGGQITTQVLIGPHGATGDIVQAITGGTGRYSGAEGELLIQGVSETKEIWTYSIQG